MTAAHVNSGAPPWLIRPASAREVCRQKAFYEEPYRWSEWAFDEECKIHVDYKALALAIDHVTGFLYAATPTKRLIFSTADKRKLHALTLPYQIDVADFCLARACLVVANHAFIGILNADTGAKTHVYHSLLHCSEISLSRFTTLNASPDGNIVVCESREQRKFLVWNVESNSIRTLDLFGQPYNSPPVAFSYDSRFVYLPQGSELNVYDTHSNHTHTLLEVSPTRIHSVFASPKDDTLAVSITHLSGKWRKEVDDRSIDISTWSGVGLDVGVFNSTGTLFAAWSNGKIIVVDVASGIRVREMHVGQLIDLRLQFTRDSQRLVDANGEYGIVKIYRLINRNWIAATAMPLLQAYLPPYVVLEILDFVCCLHHRGALEVEEAICHREKIDTIVRVQANVNGVRRARGARVVKACVEK